MNITKKDVVQSYILTTSRYNFNVHEKRIMYRIVEMQQEMLKGQKLKGKIVANQRLYDKLYEIEMPLSSLLKYDDYSNYEVVKKSLMSLEKRYLDYEDEREWKRIRLILTPKVRKYESTVAFSLHEEIYEALLNFSKGYRIYELETAFEFESAFTMRFYELFSNQKSEVTWSIETLKLMFRVENRYKQTGDFIKRIVKPAQEELNEKSPYSFQYMPLKTGKRITSIRFWPVFIAKNMNENAETKRLQNQVDLHFKFDRGAIQYLKEQYMFSEVEIKNNIELLRAAYKIIPDFILWLSEVKAKANRAGNPKGYLINALKKQLKGKENKNAGATVKKQAIRKGQPQGIGTVLGKINF